MWQREYQAAAAQSENPSDPDMSGSLFLEVDEFFEQPDAMGVRLRSTIKHLVTLGDDAFYDELELLGVVDDGEFYPDEYREYLSAKQTMPEQTVFTRSGVEVSQHRRRDIGATVIDWQHTPQSSPSGHQSRRSRLLALVGLRSQQNTSDIV